jgi:hypothetical protein
MTDTKLGGRHVGTILVLQVMQLPRLDPDKEGNEHLHALLRRVHPDDVHSFVEKLMTQPRRDRFHTYRELQVGVHFRDRGFDLRYEREIGGQTPDWCLSNEDGSPREILDVFTLHQRYEKDVEISTAIRDSGQWDGWSTVPSDHIYRKLCDKAGQYSGLAKRINLTQVLAAYGEFTASVAPKEVHHVLFVQHGGWFTGNPEISGVVYCRQKFFQFETSYYVNPHAALQSVLLTASMASRGS